MGEKMIKSRIALLAVFMIVGSLSTGCVIGNKNKDDSHDGDQIPANDTNESGTGQWIEITDPVVPTNAPPEAIPIDVGEPVVIGPIPEAPEAPAAPAKT